MKKLITCLTVLALAVGTAGMTVSAHGGHHNSGHHTNAKTKIVYHCTEDCTYCDDDGDGICDECGSKGWYCKDDCTYCDEDNDGICDSCGTKGVCSYKTKVKSKRCHH
ncbi:MAG: hypothetical protein K2J11_11670 [Oscillospiraceae bacterium]|nr:hypothetical protein [Oscillospiraceae bacterium]